MKKILITALVFTMYGCATTSEVPSNVTVVDRYIDKINYSIPHTLSKDSVFKLAKICVAEHINNDGVSLEDSSGSFVSSYTGTVYTRNNHRETASGQVFQLLDDEMGVLIIRGKNEYKSGGVIPLTNFIKYTAKIKIEDENIDIIFSNIKTAQKDTGYASNAGFNKLGTWFGSGFEPAYKKLGYVKNDIESCLLE